MILLKDIIDEFMLTTTDPDSYVSGVSRTLVLKHAKRSLENVIYAAIPDVKILQQTLPASKTLEWPIHAIDILKINYVDYDGKLIPVYENKRHPIAFEYTKDHSGNIIYDSEGSPIKGAVDTTPAEISNDESWYRYDWYYGARFGIRGGESNGIGTFKYEPETKLFYFFDFEDDAKILFEYVTNPLLHKDEAELEIEDYAREAVESSIYYKIIERRASVPMNEKVRAREEYYYNLKLAKKRILINAQRIGQSLKKARAFLAW